MNKSILEWLKVLGPLLISWPIVSLIIVLIFRKALHKLFERFMGSDEAKIGIGSLKLELGKLARQGEDAVNNFNRLNVLMAESRLLELEITEANFRAVLTHEQRKRMTEHIDELRRLTINTQISRLPQNEE